MTRTIAIVEDEDSIALALRVLLTRDGFETRRHSDGAEALDALRADPPDLVLLDVGLPGMGGFAICAALREAPGNLPVLMMSAGAGAHAAERARAAGASGFLAKPFNADDLLARVRALVPPGPLPRSPSGGVALRHG